VRSELEALRDRLNDDKIAREVVGPALLLIQAERLGVNETTLRYFAAVASGAIGGDGYVSAALKKVSLTSGEREIALLWAAALAAHGIKAEVRGVGRGFSAVASGDDAVKLARRYFLYGPPLLEGGDDVLKNHKLAEAVRLEAEGLSVSWEGLRRTPSGLVAADLTISAGDIKVKYDVYLRNTVELLFHSTDRDRAELAARLLNLAGVGAEVGKVSSGNQWYIVATTDMLAAGRKELRDALADIIRMAVESGWVDEKKAERWLEKLESGITLKEEWPKYEMGLTKGALVVRYRSTNPNSIAREKQRLEKMGLEDGRHFSVKMPEKGRDGYVYILREGLERAAWLSVHGEGEQRELAADFVEYIFQRAKEVCGGAEQCAVYEKVREIIEEGKAWGSLTLKGFEREVEVDGKKYVVKVIDGGAEFDVGRSGKPLLRIRIMAEVDGVRREYTITFGRYGRNNETRGFAVARADAPDGRSREADAERFSALVEALTGIKPRIRRMKDGTLIIECMRKHLEGFKRFAELADAIEKWLEETSR
jgi:hypothetical protein